MSNPITSFHQVKAIVVGGDEGTMHYECPVCHESVNFDGSNPSSPNTNIDEQTPAQIIFYMLDEAIRRHDNTEGQQEFGWAGNTFYHHKDLDKRIDEYIERLLTVAKINPFDFVEPCEPECSPERHAYHEGQWDMALRIKKAKGELS